MSASEGYEYAIYLEIFTTSVQSNFGQVIVTLKFDLQFSTVAATRPLE